MRIEKNYSYKLLKKLLKKNSFIFNNLKKYPVRYYRNFKRKKSYFPQEIWIENTNHCNAACVMCPRELQTRDKGIMSFDIYKKLIDEISEHKDTVERIHMHNFGEPLLDKKLPERIKYAKSKGIKHVYFVTNASLLNEKNSKLLIESGLDEFKISFYGVDKKSYNNTMVNLDFDKTLNNIINFFDLRRKLQKKNPKIVLQLIPNTIKENDSKSKWINLFNNYIDLDIGDRFNFFELHNFGDGRNYIETKDREIINTCNYPWRTMVILQNGYVTACCLDYNGSIKLGNINSKSILDIWNDRKYTKLRNDFKKLNYSDYKVCQKCDIPVN